MCGYAVDFLRSCYSSTWRFPERPGQDVRGYYFFCDPGTPHYPDWSYFGSRNWHAHDGTPDPTFGEKAGVRQRWRNGSFPIGKPDALLLGTQQCIEDGIDGAEHGVTPGTVFYFGVDLRCWRERPLFGGLAGGGASPRSGIAERGGLAGGGGIVRAGGLAGGGASAAKALAGGLAGGGGVPIPPLLGGLAGGGASAAKAIKGGLAGGGASAAKAIKGGLAGGGSSPARAIKGGLLGGGNSLSAVIEGGGLAGGGTSMALAIRGGLAGGGSQLQGGLAGGGKFYQGGLAGGGSRTANAVKGGLAGGGASTSSVQQPYRRQSTNATGSGTSSATANGTWPATTLAGNGLVAVLVGKGSTAAPNISAPTGWVRAGTDAITGFTRVGIFYKAAAAAQGTTGNFNVNGFAVDSINAIVLLAEYYSITNALPLDKTANNTGAASNPVTANTGSIASVPETLVAGFGILPDAAASGPTNGFVIVEQATSGLVSAVLADKHITVAANLNCSIAPLSTTWAARIASFLG